LARRELLYKRYSFVTEWVGKKLREESRRIEWTEQGS